MSLHKKLWLGVGGLMIVIFSGIFIISSLSAKTYLEQQLYMQNNDNAKALALSLTQQDADPVLLELILSAQFDTGHYQLIQLTDPEGKLSIVREDKQTVAGAPQWFIRLFPIEVHAGIAQVQHGWQQLGTLTLRSHDHFAYQELWANTQKQAMIFLLAIILSGILGSYLLKIILRPLDDVVQQAEAIGQRRFITIAEPRTQEFKAVVGAMNTLSNRVKVQLQKEAQQLEKWRREAHVDAITGLQTRKPFLKHLASTLQHDDANANGVITIIHITNLDKLNQHHSRQVIDTMLTTMGSALTSLALQSTNWATGRLNGSDFVVLAPRETDPAKVGTEVRQVLLDVVTNNGLENDLELPGASGLYQHGDAVSELLSSLDATLLATEHAKELEVGIADRKETSIVPAKQNLKTWLEIFDQGFKDKKFSLADYPVTNLKGELIHLEAPARLLWQDQELFAWQFLPWINRLELAADLDRQVVTLALAKIEKEGRPVCINLSQAALTTADFGHWLSDKLSANPSTASQLWMDVQETTAYRYLDMFKQLCIRVDRYGSKMGIKHAGHQLTNIGQLHDVGVDYLKIDEAFVRDINTNSANQTLLRTLCTLGHSLGVTMLAEGVETTQEWDSLESLGLDGATGPEVTRRTSATSTR